VSSFAASIACSAPTTPVSGGEDAHGGALHFLDLAVLGEQAGVAGRVGFLRSKHRNLRVEANGRAGNERFPELHAGAVERMARGEVVGAIEDDIHVREQGLKFIRLDSLLQRDDLHVGIQCAERGLRSRHFLRADGIGAVENLPLQVGQVDLVGISQGKFADAAGGKVERRGTTQAACADDERVRRAQPLLALDPYLVEKDVAAVAEELLSFR